MAKKQKVSEQVVTEALQVARATQRPGQSKEQTKLIAQGIQKGIEEYKKRYKEKTRELDKQKRKLQQAQKADTIDILPEIATENSGQQNRLSWILLLLSWIGFAVYAALYNPL
ncbi:MAG: DUF2956 family protein [Amphritea sp.]|nr:DUF2956 family protein [Amphritea sp.]